MQLSIFTKPWKTESSDELGSMVSGLGFDAIEFPLRDGYQVEPADAEKGLPKLAETLKAYNVGITSVASSTDENIFAACQAAGVPIIRIMLNNLEAGLGYMESETVWKHKLYDLLPLCEKYNVKVAVQQHYGLGTYTSMELRHVLEGLDLRYITGIWDAAHSALAGETPEKALDILWNYLAMVNFKAAYQKRVNGPEAEHAEFRPYFTTACQGASHWKNAVDYLLKRGYGGVICMPAEYTDEKNVLKYIKQDVKYMKELIGR